MFLGLDIGTTATKAILVDADQTVVARAEAAYPTAHPAPGHNEQDPALWITAVRAVLGDLRAAAPRGLAGTVAIGLSGQMHSLVILDANERPLCPAILWNDTRGAEACRELMRAVPDIGRLAGVISMPSFTAPKLLWLSHANPRLFAAIRHIVWPKDYVRLWLSGERATEMSDAASGQLLDGRRRRWAEPILTAIGISTEQLPPLLEGTEIAGRLRPALADELGLPPGIPIAAGGGDAGTGALGLGCVDEGSSFMSLGTGATFVVAQESFAPRPETLLHDYAHCVPERWYQMAALLNGASCLAWVARLTGQSDLSSLLGQVEARHRGPSRVMFLPYLNGERTPHNDTAVRGSFIGLDPSADAVEATQAVLEGVAYTLRDAMLALEAADCRVDQPGFIGGGARSPFWARIIATVLGRPIVRYEDADLGPALGAARLAIIAATGAAVADVAPPPSRRTVIEPDDALVSAYQARFETFKAFYPAIRSLHGPGKAGAESAGAGT